MPSTPPTSSPRTRPSTTTPTPTTTAPTYPEDPVDPRRTVALVPMVTGGCATSGDAHRGPHVVNPWTGRPARAGGSVTVVGPSLTWADVWATAGYAHGDDAARWLADRCPLTCVVVDPSGAVTTTTPAGTARPEVTRIAG